MINNATAAGKGMKMNGHELVTRPSIRRIGGTYWTCTCGDWHPTPVSKTPFAHYPGTIAAVVRFIKSEHAKHVEAMRSTV